VQPSDFSAWVENTIHDYCTSEPGNSLGNPAADRAFDAPLVGFSSGNDPLYRAFQQDIGSFYLTPLEVFSHAFPDQQVRPEELAVISWILPLTAVTKADNARQTERPAERWARGKLFGEKFNLALRRHLAQALTDAGFPAVVPVISPLWKVATSERYGMCSSWSERHAAYASGLGTFGLCDGLITARGKAMRCGSVVARIQLPATVRPYSGHHDYCLHFSHGACGQCAKRCPVGAISDAGHDKVKCVNYISQLRAGYVQAEYGLDVDVCGLCQTGVSCESMIPAKKARLEAQPGGKR
jgi:epoxyqueuosine reductase QueG